MNNKDPMIELLRQNELKTVSSAEQLNEVEAKYDAMQREASKAAKVQEFQDHSININNVSNSNLFSPNSSTHTKDNPVKTNDLEHKIMRMTEKVKAKHPIIWAIFALLFSALFPIIVEKSLFK